MRSNIFCQLKLVYVMIKAKIIQHIIWCQVVLTASPFILYFDIHISVVTFWNNVKRYIIPSILTRILDDLTKSVYFKLKKFWHNLNKWIN